MIRLLLYLLGKKDYESCKSCETLRQQLAIANAERSEAINTMLELVKPKPIQAYEPIKQVTNVGGVFARRQAELEARDRKAAMAMNSPFAAQSLKKPTAEEVAEMAKEIEKEVERLESRSNASENS